MTNDRISEISRRLRRALDPVELDIEDQSHLHAGHIGAKEGKGHFEVMIVSNQFEGLSRIARHRLVYDALGDFMNEHIHALSINALSPSER